MAKLTQAVVEAFRSQVTDDRAAVAGLPPGYLVGFLPTIADGRLTIRAGMANVGGQRINVPTTTLSFEDWQPLVLGGARYYVYLTSNGKLLVDNIDPQYSDALYQLIHPVTGWRYVCWLYLGNNKLVQYANQLLSDEVAAQNLFFAKSVSSQTRQAPVSGDVRSFMGMDPEGDQVAGTDPVEIAIERYNDAKWERLFGIAQRSGANIADVLLGGFLRAGEGVLSKPGTIYREGTNNFTSGGNVRGILAIGDGVVVAVSTQAEIERSTDGGKTFGTDISNSHNAGNGPLGIVQAGNNIFAFGSNGELSKSTDDAVSWGTLISQDFSTNSDGIFDASYNAEDDVLIFVGEATTVMRITTNAGSSYSAPTSAPAVALAKIRHVSDDTWVAVASASDNAYISHDNGDNWGAAVPIDTGSGGGCQGLAVSDDGVLVVSRATSIWFSVDGGESWTESSYDTTPSSGDVRGIDYAKGVFFSGRYASYDNGRSFTRIGLAESAFDATYDATNDIISIAAANGVTYYSTWLEAGAGIVEAGGDEDEGYEVNSIGWCHAWKRVAHSSLAMTTASGSLRHSGALAKVNFPVTFAAIPQTTVVSAQPSGGGLVWATKDNDGPSTTQWGKYFVACSDSLTQDVVVELHAWGFKA